MAGLPTSSLISSSHRSGSSDPYCLVKVDDEVVARCVVSRVWAGEGTEEREPVLSRGAGSITPPLEGGGVLSGFKGAAYVLASRVLH